MVHHVGFTRTILIFTTSLHTSNTLFQHDRKLSIMHCLQFVCRLRIYIYIYKIFFLKIRPEWKCLSCGLEGAGICKTSFPVAMGPSASRLAVGKGPRDRQTSVRLFVDCRAALFSCWWYCHIVNGLRHEGRSNLHHTCYMLTASFLEYLRSSVDNYLNILEIDSFYGIFANYI
jgi:hypothetical protein